MRLYLNRLRQSSTIRKRTSLEFLFMKIDFIICFEIIVQLSTSSTNITNEMVNGTIKPNASGIRRKNIFGKKSRHRNTGKFVTHSKKFSIY